MRKSIKALSALACAAAVVLTAAVPAKAEMVTTHEQLTDEAKTEYDAIDPYSIDAGTTYYTLTGGSTKVAWAPLAVDNIMTENKDHAGVYEMTLKLPAYDEKNSSLNEFKMCTIDDTVLSDGWDHALIAGTTFYGDNMSRFRVACEEETEVTVYWDTTTGAVVVTDADGKEIDYMISFCGYDNELNWMTVEDMSNSSFSDYAADKAAIAQGAGCTEIPNLAKLNKDLVKKLNSEATETTTAAEETTAASAETTAASAETTTAAPQATTTAQTSPKTGDAAPVAVAVSLFAAVAAVVFVSKKKEA